MKFGTGGHQGGRYSTHSAVRRSLDRPPTWPGGAGPAAEQPASARPRQPPRPPWHCAPARRPFAGEFGSLPDGAGACDRHAPAALLGSTASPAPVATPWGEMLMPVIVVTRLRLKDPALLDEFFTDAVAAIQQAQKSDGNLGADALADANNAWWSVSSWQARGPMRAFVRSEPHRSITARLDHYCDEATFADWEQDSPDLPDWQMNWRHLTADGKVAELTDASPANQTREFHPPGEPPAAGT